MAQRDPQGIIYTTANAAGMRLYEKIVREMSCFQAAVFDSIEAAIAANPTFGMPYFAKAYLNLYMTEPQFRDAAVDAMNALRAAIALDRLTVIEQAHARAIDRWIGGDLKGACDTLDRLGCEEPREILALRVGHEMDFFAGATRNLRDRVARQLPSWSRDDPHYGIVLGAYAFGLEENGHYEQAEAVGRQALEFNRADAWAVHAVAHTLEMRGYIGEGIRFMTERVGDWGENNLFSAHNWWHTALFHLDGGDADQALRIYDAALYNDASVKVALVMLDASSLLWRMHLEGLDVSSRARPRAAEWRKILPARPYYLFNDVHASMAHVAAHDLTAAAEVVARIDRYLAGGDDGTHAFQIAKGVGRPICQALLEFGQGRYGACVDSLYPIRGRASELGGSLAQRDVLDRTVLAAALKGKIGSVARSLAAEHVSLKAGNPSNWRRYAEVLTLNGAPRQEVEKAAETAARLTAGAHLQAQKLNVTEGRAHHGR
jgi:tetratricopeptide (TPR) repeat protein